MKMAKMKNAASYMKFFMLMVSSAVLFGCATADKPLVMNDLSSLSPLKVIRFDTPEIEKFSFSFWSGVKAALLPTTWLFGGFFRYGSILVVAQEEGRALREKCLLSDYGQLVMNKFTEKAAKDIPTWPTMLIEDTPVQTEMPPMPTMLIENTPVQKDYEYKSDNILSFHVDYIRLNDYGLGKGLNTGTVAEIHTLAGDLIWRKRYDYSQKKADRERDLEELEANDCKLLKEEMDHAAEKTAAEFTNDIKRSSQQFENQ